MAFSNSSILSNEGAFHQMPYDIGRQYLDKFAIRVIAPAMVSTADYRRTSFTFGYDGEASMTTDIMEAPNCSILGQNQEDRVGSDIVAIVSTNFSKATVVREAVPCLNCQRQFSIIFLLIPVKR
jgi:hypothetical protein